MAAQEVCRLARHFPEFDRRAFEAEAPATLGPALARRLAGAASGPEVAEAEANLRWGYWCLRNQRVRIRAQIGAALRNYAAEPTIRGAPGTCGLLRVLRSILLGMPPSESVGPPPPPGGPREGPIPPLLREVLLPLYSSHRMANELTAMLALYHQDLARCLLAACERAPHVSVECLAGLMQCIPEAKDGASKKTPLLLQSAEAVLARLVPQKDLHSAWTVVLPALERAMLSEHASMSQRALRLFSREQIVEGLQRDRATAGMVAGRLLPAVLQEGRPSWNASASKMRRAAAEAMRAACVGGLREETSVGGTAAAAAAEG